MWLVVGLGNPGRKYSRTRHNIGFLVAEAFAEERGWEFQEKAEYRICRGSMGGETIALLEPLTFMNRSGSAVRQVMSRSNAIPERLIVIQDDLDMPTGRLRIRKTGSSGGHRGVQSIIESIGSKDFIRIKIGIGRDPFVPAEEFVLSKFSKSELSTVKDAVSRALEAIGSIITEGVEKAMNRFN